VTRHPYDFAIIGGGVIGLSIALELSDHGQDVIVVDRQQGVSASWAAGGILPSMDADRASNPLDRLHGQSYRMYPDWVARIQRLSGIDVEFWPCGGMHVARTAGEIAALRAIADTWQQDGIEFTELSTRQASELEPDMACGDRAPPQLIYLVPGESQVRTPRLLQGLRIACHRNNVILATTTGDVSWQLQSDRSWRIQHDANIALANGICLSTGAWTGRAAASLGVRLELEPRRGQMILLPPSSVALRRIINEGPRYLVPRRDGQILVGSTVEDVGFDQSTRKEDLRELHTFAAGLVPGLADVPIAASWAGLRPRTGDGNPFLGKLPGTENAFVAAGHFRSGILLAPITALLMCQFMLGESPSADLAPFRVDRE
jgi:glycine oxidase